MPAAAAAAMDSQIKQDQYNYRTTVICELLRTGRITGSVSCAKYTAKLVDLLVDIGDRVGKYHDHESLVERLKELRAKLQAAGPEQVAITNLILRVLHLIRTESNAEHDPEAPEATSSAASPDQPQTLHQPSPPLRSFGRVVSLSNIMEQPLIDAARASVLEDLDEHDTADSSAEHETLTTRASDAFATLSLKEGKEQDAWPHKEATQSALKELFAELEDVDGQVAAHSTDHILNNTKILTHGFDETVLRVLKEAKKKHRKFSVYVTTQEPHNSGRLMASALTAAGINTVLIRDHDIGNVMSRMDQVFLGVHCFLANGAVVGRNGARPVALMAAARKVPVLAFGGHHKLTPVFMEDNPRSNVEPSLPMFAYSRFPAAVVCPEGVDSRALSQRASMYDVVASRHVTLLVTDVGVVQPEFLPMLLPDFYCREDFALAMQA